MTAKKKNNEKNSEKSEKSAASSQDDASKKAPKSSGPNGVSGPAPQGPRSGGCLGLFITTVFYVALMGAAGFAAFYLQQVMEEFRQANAKQEMSAQHNAEMISKMENVLQQVESLRSNVDGLESSLGVTRVELESAVSRVKRGEVETRRVEETLQKLQNDLLRDLSEGIKEVKEARERDFSSLEKTVEERLAEVSQSISASVAEFTEAQGAVQSQMADLKARLGDAEDPALIKQELSAIVDVVAEMKAAKQGADTTADSLREQISTVREELQTRNHEVASMSQELETVRSVVQETTGSLRQTLSAAEAELQALKEQTATLQSGVNQAAAGLRSVEEKVDAAADQAQKNSEELASRDKSSEDNGDLSASLSDLTTKVEMLFSKYDAHESSLVAQGDAVERAKADLKQELEAVKSSMEKRRSNEAQREDDSMDSSSHQMEDLERRLTALEDSSSLKPEPLEGLKTMVDGLERKAAKLEDHDQAISALQEALQETTQKLSVIFEGKKDEGGL